MSLWSRIVDALGSLVEGESLSEVFAKLRTPPERTVGFTIAVIALGAKMAKADGRVTRDEVSAFREVFTIPQSEEANAARIFNMARTDVAGFDVYADRVASMFEDRKDVLVDLLEGLVHIAIADGVFHPSEEQYLEVVRQRFGISDADFRAMKARRLPDIADPYLIMGLPTTASDEEVRQRWRALVRELHPDSMIARGVPEEAWRLAEKRLAAINDAHETIRRERDAA